MKYCSLWLSVIFFGIMLSLNPALEGTLEDAFTEIYDRGVWGKDANGQGTSGGGSRVGTTKVYRMFLQHFFQEYDIRSVVDVGCGDWEFSKEINWEGIEYLGVDVVKSVIDKNNSLYQRKNIKFIHQNALNSTLPTADLLICKDVLQHLTIEDILLFIQQFANFKYCLITNDVDPWTGTGYNYQIFSGGYRPIDLTQPPFNVRGVKVLGYPCGTEFKQALLIINKNTKAPFLY